MMLLTLACALNSGTVSLDDSSNPAEGDADTDSDSDADSDADSDPEPQPDYSVWIGNRVVETGDCTERLDEEGEALYEDWEYWDYVVEACPECDWFYEIQVSPGEVCGYSVSTTTYRGLDLRDGQATVVSFSNQGTSTLDSRADFDGWTIKYDYDYGELAITGTVEFPEL